MSANFSSDSIVWVDGQVTLPKHILKILGIENGHRSNVTFIVENGEVKIKNESEPKFEELSVYYMVFSGVSVSDAASKIVEKTVHNVGLPVVEQDFKGRIQ